MRAVIQRVTHASVTIQGQIKGQIDNGYLILLGVCEEDLVLRVAQDGLIIMDACPEL